MPNKTILRSPYGQQEEARASTAIKCGHLCELHTDTELTHLVRPHNNDNNAAEIMVAHEDALQGRSRATDYSADELVQLRILNRGDLFLAKLKASENVTIGDRLVSAGDGTLKKASATETTTNSPVILAISQGVSNVGTVADLVVRVL
jgi:hypothetical protein